MPFYYDQRRKKITIIISIAAVVIVFFAAFCVYYYLDTTKKTVTILSEYNKYTATVYGNACVSDALSTAGIILRPEDVLYAKLSDSVQNDDIIYINYEESSEAAIGASSVANTSIFVTPNIVDTPAGSYYYYSEVQIEASAYCSCPICCAPYDGSSTASGTRPAAYHTIATPSIYDFGTTVYIPYFSGQTNGGIFVVEDRGGAIQGNRIDIYFNTHEEALIFGRRTLTMYILDVDSTGI